MVPPPRSHPFLTDRRCPVTSRVMMGLAVTALLIAAHPREDDKDELQGSWGIPSLEFAGMRLDGPEDQRLVFAGDKTWLQEVDKAGYRSTFKSDPSATPRTLDMEYIEGPDKGKTVLGIYRLE